MSPLFANLFGAYRRVTFMSSVLIAACAAGYWQFQDWQKTKTALSALVAQANLEEKNLVLGKNLSEDLKDLQAIEATLAPGILQVDKKATNIGYFYTLESATQVHIEGVIQEPIKETIKQGDKTYSVIPFLLTATGTFEALQAFLNAIHDAPMFLQVRQLSLERIDPKAREKDMHNIRLTLRVGALGL